MSMMDSVLKKTQLHHNIDALREIDDDAVDDDVRNTCRVRCIPHLLTPIFTALCSTSFACTLVASNLPRIGAVVVYICSWQKNRLAHQHSNICLRFFT